MAKRLVGYLPEDYSFEPFLTGKQFLDCYGRMSLLTAPERKEMSEKVIDLLGLGKYCNLKISGYSKGMRQRLGIAQALMNRPRLLVLDEPTEGLDPLGRHDVRDLLRKTRDEGCTIFLNSHLLSEIELLCDRVAVLNEGKLIRVGTIDEFTRNSTGYVLRISHTALESMPELVGAFQIDSQPDVATISVPNAESLNLLVDLLRNKHIHIESINPMRSTLEEVFIQIVSDRENARQA
jgi:ABC-2 type transport system ATP-binding protein